MGSKASSPSVTAFVLLALIQNQDLLLAGRGHQEIIRDDGIFDLRTSFTNVWIETDGGWSLDLSEPVLARALCHVDNAYWIPHVRLHGRVAHTHKTSQTAFRGFGGPQGMLVIEDILGRVAPMLGLDAATLRRVLDGTIAGSASPS